MSKPKKLTKAYLKKKEKRLNKRVFKEKLKLWRDKVIQRDKGYCQICNKPLLTQPKNVHHIISLSSVKRKYPDLLENIDNGILLCSYDHKFAPNSPHQSGVEFGLWLQEHKPEQYNNLITILKNLKV